MKVLKILEEKVSSLVSLVKELKTENVRLVEENAQLGAKIKSLEHKYVADTQRLDELGQEKISTKVAVDNLIKSIDSLVKAEKQ